MTISGTDDVARRRFAAGQLLPNFLRQSLNSMNAKVCASAMVVAGLLVLPAAATAGSEDKQLLELDGKNIRIKYVRELPPARATDMPGIGVTHSAQPSFPKKNSVSIAKKKRTVTREIKRAHKKGTIDLEAQNKYLSIYKRAVSTWKRLGYTRKKELGSVIAQVQRLARLKKLTGGRMPAVFFELDGNRRWWGAKGAPKVGARVTFTGSRVIFQYYAGQGLRMQPLANCGTANGYWSGGKKDKLKELLDELIALRVQRSAPGGVTFSTLEYYFPFGGGSAPWFSAMAQGTCIQALARAGVSLNDTHYHTIAKSMLPIFTAKTPKGVRVKRGGGNWYVLYNFAPSLRVLNGDLQALIGLHDMYVHAGNNQALDLFNKGDVAARNQLPTYDTGAWSLYRPGREADLNYHKLQRDFLKRLCTRVQETFGRPADNIYCTTATHFTNYLKTAPTLTGVQAAPAPVKQGKRTGVRFKLSKVSRVGLTVRNGDGKTVFATSASFGYGSRKIYWTAPGDKTGTYSYSLSATDLAGNKSSLATGSIRVIKAKKKKK